MTSKREQLIETAVELFAEHGYHGTGIDRIASEANVTKKTMYRYFRTKDELILAALRHYDGLFRNQFMIEVEARGDTAYERLLGLFDAAKDWFAGQKFFGCMFINAIGEYSEPDTAIRQVCKDFKQQVRSYILQLVKDAGIADAESTTSA